MIVMTLTGMDGEGCHILAHEFYKDLHTIADLVNNDRVRDKYEKAVHNYSNPQFYQLIKMPNEEIKEGMKKSKYEAMTKEEKRKWLINELQKLENE